MAWQTPKTDWTKEDYYNYVDLNRVENNTNELLTLLSNYNTPPTLTTIINRNNTNIEFYDSLNRIENNILTIKNATYQPVNWITPVSDWKSLDIFDYSDANRLENNLLALYILINNIYNSLLYCGNFSCGQDNTYL